MADTMDYKTIDTIMEELSRASEHFRVCARAMRSAEQEMLSAIDKYNDAVQWSKRVTKEAYECLATLEAPHG
jgi:hypothetical protein